MEISDTADFYCCRICLQNGETSINLESIFEAHQDKKIELTPATMISTITPVKIIYNDGYPSQICTTCKSNLDTAYQFYHLSINSDRKLRSKFLGSKSGIIKQEIDKSEEADDEDFERFDASYEEQNEVDDEMLDDSLPISHLEVHVNEVKSEEANLTDEIQEDEDSEEEEEDDSEDDEPIINIKRKKTRNRAKTPKEKVEHKCEVCNKIFAKPYRLRRHMNVHNTSKPFECPDCFQRFVSEINLQRHSIIHTDLVTPVNVSDVKPKIFACQEGDCMRVFEKQESLASHMRIHKNDTEPREYKCDLCDRTFSKLNLLTRHAKQHDENKIHKCSLCNKTFALGGQLIDHINRHKGFKPHKCEICDKKFQQACTLKDHMRTHSGETPFLCPQCGKSFNNSSNLRQHMIRHTGLKPYACAQCPSRFSCKAGLNSHKVVHTGLKPYICDICGSSFTKSCSLVKHKRTHTGERPYPCDVCEMR